MSDDKEDIDLEIDSPSALTGYIEKKFEDAENGRVSDELRLQAVSFLLLYLQLLFQKE